MEVEVVAAWLWCWLWRPAVALLGGLLGCGPGGVWPAAGGMVLPRGCLRCRRSVGVRAGVSCGLGWCARWGVLAAVGSEPRRVHCAGVGPAPKK